MPFRLQGLLRVEPEVRDALASRRGVVALESTLIAHGMPYPANLETTERLAGAIRAAGAVPAVIAVADGRILVGLSSSNLQRIAEGSAVKLSRRDVAGALAKGWLGATTVASTMACAHLAGIRVFATGGIGGVHRGAAETFDVSADLDELGRTPVAVVSAGAKAILDLPLTLEYLETRGVPVLGFGTDTLPAFYTRSSGLPLHLRCDTADEVANLLVVQDALGFGNGTLVANPIPEADALPEGEIAAAIDEAVAAAARAQVTGKALTPFLLRMLAEVTSGRSLKANIALVAHNAHVAAEIAVAYSRRRSARELEPGSLA